MSQYIAKEVSVLFSGGSDSGLAAALCLEKFERVILLTFDPGYLFFIKNSQTMTKWLQNKFGQERVEQRLIDSRKAIKDIMFADYKGDFRKYGFNMTNLSCLSCRLSMHAMAIIHNLEYNIPYLADGAISKQATGPEQMVSVIERNQNYYSSQFGIVQFSPIYHEERSDEVLHKMGIAPIKKLKHQFILFDTQATCPFGVPAEVFGRMFYGLLGESRKKDGELMCNEKYPLMQDFIKQYFQVKGVDLEQAVEKLKEIHGQTNFDREKFYEL